MQVEKADAGPAKRVLTAMVTSDAVCGRIAARWEPGGLFAGKWENIIGGWCVKYFGKYGTAPGREIESRFAAWAADAKDPETVELVEKFLGVLSDEYEKRGDENTEYLVDLASTYFNRHKMVRLADAIRGDCLDGADTRAAERIIKFNRIELGVGAGVDVLRDKTALKEALANPEQNLVEYPEGLKFFFDGMLARDTLIGFMAAMKRGKTFWQLDLAWRGMEQKRRVAFFEIGDMSQNQIMRRFAVRAAQRPLKPTNGRPILFPTFIEHEPNSRKCSVTHKKGKFCRPLDYRTARDAMQRITGDLGVSDCLLRLSCHPTATINVPGIVNVLDGWERQGWVPDIIVVDYADLLAPISAKEQLHQIDETWAALRALSQSRHCLVVTATQANAASFRAEQINETHFAGNKLKLAHVVGMVGISATGAEKQIGVCRLNWVVRREGEFDVEKACFCAGCLALANPAVKSVF